MRNVATITLMLTLSPWVGAAADETGDVTTFQKLVQPVLQKFCVDCHGADVQEGILVSQDPLDGGFAYNFQRVTTDTTGGHTYDMIDAANRLMDHSRLTAGKP